MKGFIFLSVLFLSGYKISYTEAIAPGETCVTNGALAANPADTTQFFYCSNGIVYLGSCTNGLNFDPNTAQCTASGGLFPNGPLNCANNNYATFAYPGDNTRYYYCLNNQALVVQCPANSIYNVNLRTCIQEGSVSQCQPGVTAFIATGCTTFTLCMNGIASQQTCPNGYYFLPSSASCGPDPPAGCNGNGGGTTLGNCTTEGAVQANSNNCQSYLVCTNKSLVSRTCPAGYYFSSISLTCGPTIPSGCRSNDQPITYPVYPNYPYPNYPYPNNPFPNYPFPNPISDPIPIYDSSICSNYQNALLADASNCQHYYQCVSGVAYSLFCGNGLFFNPATGSCGTSIPPTCNLQNGNGNGISCPSFGEITMIDPNNCKNYISCTNGFGTSYSCGAGLFYNPQMNSCSPIAPAGCVPI